MKIVELTPPGRFPTVVLDPGRWWDGLAADPAHTLVRYSANAAWWRAVCDGAVAPRLLQGLGFGARLVRRLEWAAAELDVAKTGRASAQALARLAAAGAFESAEAYRDAVAPIAAHVESVSRAQGEFAVSLDAGPRVRGLNYAASVSLSCFARRDGVLAGLVREALKGAPAEIDLLLVRVTSPEDLLTALIAVRILRERHPRMHACLADHGYENFSLHPHVAKLRGRDTLTSIFDSIVESRDERDLVVPALAVALKAGRAPRGFITLKDLGPDARVRTAAARGVPPVETFAPEPVLWTRVSPRRCYWSRCTFCVQNVKYDDRRTPLTTEAAHALDRIEAQLAAGYRTVIFSDEALSPALLRVLCAGIRARGLSFRWACRCKMELAHTRELFQEMSEAGCYEVLYGLESISPRVQKLMDKHVAGLDADRVRTVLGWMEEAGLGVHINLIGNFPGDTIEEVAETVEFTMSALAGSSGATFLLNRFALFPDTPIARDPAAFGLVVPETPGDMPMELACRRGPGQAGEEQAIDARFPELRERLLRGLGWRRVLPDGDEALSLYFGSGHGAIFKSKSSNPFANPLIRRETEVAS